MADTLREMLTEYDDKKHATDAGSAMHKKMRFVNALDGDDDIVKQIKSRPELAIFFTENAQTEVPIAATINGKFVSRRIDRMVVDDKNKIVHILDYKTDVNKDAFCSKYIIQVREYMSIIGKIYPKYKVNGYILWLHDWTLEKL